MSVASNVVRQPVARMQRSGIRGSGGAPELRCAPPGLRARLTATRTDCTVGRQEQ